MASGAIRGACHCGAVTLTLPAAPTRATLCNCSSCRRLGALWAYYDVSEVLIDGEPERTDEYVWGDRTLRTVRCKTCGCVTHWAPLKPGQTRMGINIRNFDPVLMQHIQLRRFDGADSWTFVD